MPPRTLVSLAGLVVFALLLPPLAAEQPAAKPSTSRIQKKTYDFKDAGKEMEYALFVPTSYAKDKKTPLVILLHGLFSNPQQIMRYRGLTDQAEKHGCIVAAPMGYNTTGGYGAQGPRGGFNSNPPNLGELSEKDVMNVLDIVRKEYTVDPDRIYLMGHSMGGGGTLHLAMKYPDVWAGLGPIAPALFSLRSADLAKIKHIPVILVQGDKDNLCPPAAARRWVEEMKKLGMTHEYVEVPGGDHISIASPNLPRMFDFFAKHARKPR